MLLHFTGRPLCPSPACAHLFEEELLMGRLLSDFLAPRGFSSNPNSSLSSETLLVPFLFSFGGPFIMWQISKENCFLERTWEEKHLHHRLNSLNKEQEFHSEQCVLRANAANPSEDQTQCSRSSHLKKLHKIISVP